MSPTHGELDMRDGLTEKKTAPTQVAGIDAFLSCKRAKLVVISGDRMGTEFALVTYDRSELNYDLLSFKGMAREAKIRMREADAKKKAKQAAKAAAETDTEVELDKDAGPETVES